MTRSRLARRLLGFSASSRPRLLRWPLVLSTAYLLAGKASLWPP
jgi:hypothetical protein